jgi:hypothetical protein
LKPWGASVSLFALRRKGTDDDVGLRVLPVRTEIDILEEHEWVEKHCD